MKTTKQFVADDGTTFDTRREALAHEEQIRICKQLGDISEEDVADAFAGDNEALADAFLDAAKIVRAQRKGREG